MRSLVFIAALFPSLLNAAELSWKPEYNGAEVPAGWALHRSSKAADAKIAFEDGALVLNTAPGPFVHLERDVDIDGTDEAPLRAQCVIERSGGGTVAGSPVSIGLTWDGKHALMIGLGNAEAPGAAVKSEDAPRRKPWCEFVDGDQQGVLGGDDLFSACDYGYFRIVVSSRDVSAYASKDGLVYRVVASFARGEGHFSGPPKKVVIGRCGFAGGECLDGDADAAGLPEAYRVRNVVIGNDKPKPSGRMPSGYKKLLTWEDTVAALGSGALYGNPNAPEGKQVAYITGKGSFSQTARLPAGTYFIAYRAAQRANWQSTFQSVRLSLDGKAIDDFQPAGERYQLHETKPVTIEAGDHTLTFAGLNPNGGDNTILIDEVRVHMGLSDGGFEKAAVGKGNYSPLASGSAWTFTGSGVSGNQSGFTIGNPNAPEGEQVAYLQTTGTVSQTIELPAGKYLLSFVLAQRGNIASAQTVQVRLDDQALGSVSPPGTWYQGFSLPFETSGGKHTLAFVGLNPNGADNTAFIDQVGLECAEVQFAQTGFETPDMGPADFQKKAAGSAWSFSGSSGIVGNGVGQTPRRWRVIGPFPGTDASITPQSEIGDAWISAEVADEARGQLNLKQLLNPSQEGLVCYATATFFCERAREERFTFDTEVGGQLWLNGKLIANQYEWIGARSLSGDRLSAAGMAQAGENKIFLRLVSGLGGVTGLLLRHENADPMQRIDALRQLLSDFPDDKDFAVPGMQEIALLWEAQGFLAQAIAALGEILDRANVAGEQLDAVDAERARLYRALRDQDGVVKTLEGLIARKQASAGGDEISKQLGIAHLWEQMELPERAAAVVEALTQRTDLSADRLIDVFLEKIRLDRVLKRETDLGTLYSALAERLPKERPERARFAFEAMRASVERDDTANVEKTISALEKSASERDLLIRLHALLAASAEGGDKRVERVARLKKIIALHPPTSAWDDLEVECAEALAAPDKESKANPKEALDHYRAALANLPDAASDQGRKDLASFDQARSGDAAAALGLARAMYLRAALRQTAIGRRLLAVAAQSSGIPTGPVRDWFVLGPFDNADWKAFDQQLSATPLVPTGSIDTAAPIAGKSWTKPEVAAYARGCLDLMRCVNAANSIAFVYKKFEAASECDAMLSFGSDDGIALWVNGENLHTDRVQRGLAIGQFKRQAHFKKGANTLLAMVQQGVGDWSIELSIETDPASTLASRLTSTPATIEETTQQAAVLNDCVADFIRAGRIDEAVVVAAATVRAMANHPALQLAVADQVLSSCVGSTVAAVDQLPQWLESFGERRSFKDHDKTIATLRGKAIAALRARGDLESAENLVAAQQYSDPRAEAQAATLADFGDLYRQAGYLDAASDFYRKALDRGFTDQRRKNLVAQALWSFRLLKTASIRANGVSLDGGTLAQAADRLAAGGNLDSAAQSYQRAIDSFGSEYIRLAPHRIAGVRAYCQERLHELGPAAFAAWRKEFDAKALGTLGDIAAADEAALVRLLQNAYPSSRSDDALDRLANAQLDHGSPERAASMIAAILADHPDSNLDRALLLAKYVTACRLAGNATGMRKALDLLSDQFKAQTLTIGGKKSAVSAFVDEQRKALESVVAEPWSQAGCDLRHSGFTSDHPVPAERTLALALPLTKAETSASYRFEPSPFRSYCTNGALDSATLYVASADELFAIDLAGNRLRWRSGKSWIASRHSETSGGLPENMPALTNGAVFARLTDAAFAGQRSVISAHRTSDGALLWSSANDPALSELDVLSSPSASGGKVYALAQEQRDPRQRFLICWNAAAGRLAWRTKLYPGTGAFALTNYGAISVSAHLAAPAIAGNDLFIATDAGCVTSLDATTGSVRWVVDYDQALIDPSEGRNVIRQLAGRAASRVVVGAERIYCAPRDTAALLAIDRSTGEIVWQQRLSSARALLGIASTKDSERMLVEGRGLACLDGANGRTLWRWHPPAATALHGVGAIGGPFVYIGSDAGLHRIKLEDGSEYALASWPDLGVDRPIGNLMLRKDRIIGFDDQHAVVLRCAANEEKPGKPVAATAVEAHDDAQLATASVVPADVSGPLVMRAHLADASPRLALPCSANGSDAYLVGDGSLTRYDAQKQEVRWRTAIAPGALRVASNDQLLVVGYERFCAAYDAKTGAGRWTWTRPTNDCGFTFAPVTDSTAFGEILIQPQGVCIHYRDAWQTYVLEPSSGAVKATFQYSGSVRGIMAMDDQLVAVVMDTDQVRIETRAIATGNVTHSKALPVGGGPFRQLFALPSSDGKLLHVCSERFIATYDVAAQRELYVQNAGGGFMTAWSEGRYLTTFYTSDERTWSQHIVDAQSGEVALSGAVHGGPPTWATPFHVQGEQAIRLASDQNRLTLLCQDFAAKKEAWRVDQGPTASWTLRAMLRVGPNLVQIWGFQQALRYRVIDLSSGKTLGEGDLPGSPNDEQQTSACTVAGQIIYASKQGFYSVGGYGGKDLGDDVRALLKGAAPATEAARRGAMELLAAQRESLSSAAAAKPVVIDGQLDEWPSESASLDGWQRLRIRHGKPLAEKTRVRSLFDGKFVYIAVEVDDASLTLPVFGQRAVCDADALLLAFDHSGLAVKGNDANALSIVAITVHDGLAAATLVNGPGVDAADAKTSAQVARRAGGLTYEVAIPWSALRPGSTENPGANTDLGFSFAVLDADADGSLSARIWGGGILDGLQPASLGQLNFVK